MRIFLIVAAFGVAFTSAFAIVRFDGRGEADMAFAAIVVCVFATGVGLIALVDTWVQRNRGPGSFDAKVRNTLGLRETTPLCTECRRPMTQLGTYLVCAGCDQILVGR